MLSTKGEQSEVRNGPSRYASVKERRQDSQGGLKVHGHHELRGYNEVYDL